MELLDIRKIIQENEKLRRNLAQEIFNLKIAYGEPMDPPLERPSVQWEEEANKKKLWKKF